MKSLGTDKRAMKYLGGVWDQWDICEVSRNNLDTIRIAVKSLGRG